MDPDEGSGGRGPLRPPRSAAEIQGKPGIPSAACIGLAWVSPRVLLSVMVMKTTRCIDFHLDALQADSGRARDRVLTARIERGDASALREVMDAHAAAVHGMARSIVADAGVAEEVAQDVFFAVWTRPERYDPSRAALGTYLVGMARNKAIDRLRSHRARDRATDSLKELARVNGHSRHAEHRVELRTSLIPLIERLSAAQREALVLAFYGGRTYNQVAEELGIPEGTAKTRLRQALLAIRAGLQETDAAALR